MPTAMIASALRRVTAAPANAAIDAPTSDAAVTHIQELKCRVGADGDHRRDGDGRDRQPQVQRVDPAPAMREGRGSGQRQGDQEQNVDPWLGADKECLGDGSNGECRCERAQGDRPVHPLPPSVGFTRPCSARPVRAGNETAGWPRLCREGTAAAGSSVVGHAAVGVAQRVHLMRILAMRTLSSVPGAPSPSPTLAAPGGDRRGMRLRAPVPRWFRSRHRPMGRLPGTTLGPSWSTTRSRRRAARRSGTEQRSFGPERSNSRSPMSATL